MTRFQYDALNRNSLTIDPEGRTAGKTYDADGRVLVERRGDGAPASATNDVVAYITRGYADNGQVATFADANPGTTSYTYDAFDRLVRTSFPTSGTGATNAGDYEELTLDVAGNVTARRTRSALSITMTYDRLNRMKTKVVPASGSIPTRTATYAYDLAGRQDVVTETGGHNLDWSANSHGELSMEFGACRSRRRQLATRLRPPSGDGSDESGQDANDRPGTRIDDKIRPQLGPRGWTEDEVQEVTSGEPSGESRDNTRSADGTRRDEPASVYGTEKEYVVVNDRTRQVVQVSDKTDPGFKPDARIRWKPK